jgi:hypothetical protein
VAVALSEEFKQAAEEAGGFGRVGVILCGGNVDLMKLPWQ